MKASAIIFVSLVVAVCGQSQPADGAVDAKGKLPYSTGSIVNVTSGWLRQTCEVKQDKQYPDGSGCYKATAGDVEKHRHKLPTFMDSTVFCNKSTDGSDDKDDCGGGGGEPSGGGGGDCMGYWDCALKSLNKILAPLRGVVTKQPGTLRGIHAIATETNPTATAAEVEVDLPLRGGWDLGGFTLMGTDFTDPNILEGTPVFLKSQVAYKFCHVDPAHHWAIVCDRMTSGGSWDKGGGGGDGEDEKFELVKAPEDLVSAVLPDSVNYPDGSSTPDAAKPLHMIIRSTLTGRFCAPNKDLHPSAPMTCNFKESHLTAEQVLLFTMNSPYPPYKSGEKAAAPAA